MTDAELDAIRHRCEMATSGPWAWSTDPVCVTLQSPTHDVLWYDAFDDSICARPWDREFLAHARVDVPTLLNELDWLQAENARLRLGSP